MLSRHEVAWVAVDSDPKVVEEARKEGAPIWFGDAGRAEFLKRCGVQTAPALVVTMDAAKKVEDVVTCARAIRPELIIVARARDHRHAARLYELGVTDAVPETIEASLQLAENALVDIGIPMGPVIASIHERRDEFRRLFREKKEGLGEPRALRPTQR
jgi:CPA2 family monovalent cation:H+ antiporter-2